MLSLKEFGWGPPAGVTILARKVSFLISGCVVFIFLFRKSGSELFRVSGVTHINKGLAAGHCILRLCFELRNMMCFRG